LSQFRVNPMKYLNNRQRKANFYEIRVTIFSIILEEI